MENEQLINIQYFLNGGGLDPDLVDNEFTLRPEGYPNHFINDEKFRHIKSLAEGIQFKKTAHFPVGSVKVENGYGLVKFSATTHIIANKLLRCLKDILWFEEIERRVSFFKVSAGGLAWVAEVSVSQKDVDWAFAKRKVRQNLNCNDPATNWHLIVERKLKFSVKFVFLCDRDLFVRLYRACAKNEGNVGHTITLAGCVIRLGIPQKYMREVILPAVEQDDTDDEIEDEQLNNIDRLYEEQIAQ